MSQSVDLSGDLLPSSQNDSDYIDAISSRPSTSSSNDQKAMTAFDRQLGIEATRLRFAADPSLARACLRALPIEIQGWCQICTMKPSKDGGYIQVSAGGANKFATLQEVVLWAKGISLYPGEQCSHLCARPTCVGLDHIIAESERENQRRKGCVVWVDCPHCALKISACVHGDVKCIKYSDGYSDAASFGAAGLHS